jgi:hypothetical protein
LVRRQEDGERCAPADGAVHLDPSLVIGDGLVHERETEAEAAAVSGGLAAGEALE